MSGRIPQSFIDQLVARVDIVDLINSRVPLKKAGKDYTARCPFHDEKSPSFSVSRDKQFYYCFGCGAKGTSIGFLMEYEHLGFVEAVEELASREGLEVPREGGDAAVQGPDLRPIYETLEQAAAFFQHELRHHAEAHRAVGYLKGRGMSGEVAAAYGIGFAPPGWDALRSSLGADLAGLEHLKEAGMVLQSEEGRAYDRFRDRIMFPIRDTRGRVIGFGGRVLGDEKPKYLNNPETPVFHKGRELYGLYEARKAERHLERLLVVEGYMDVVALAQYGIRYAVATLGTASTPDHLERIFRLVPEVVFSFDGDRAGRDAAWKALNVALPFMRDGRSVRFLFLPEGEDPDTLIRQEGREAFEQRIRTALTLSDYLFRQLAEQTDVTTPDGKARLAELARPLVGRLPAGVYRDLIQKELDQRVGVAVAVPAAENTRGPRRRAPLRTGGAQSTFTPVRRAISLVLQRPDLAHDPNLPQSWRQSEAKGVALLSRLLSLAQEPGMNTGRMVEHFRDTEDHAPLEKLAAIDFHVPEEGIAAEFRDTLERIGAETLEHRLSALVEKARAGGLSETEAQLMKRLLAEKHGVTAARAGR